MTEPRKPMLKKLAGRAALALGGATIGFLVARGAGGLAPVRESLQALSGWDLLALPLVWLFVVAVHEGGHLLGGLGRGMRFLLLIVGPLGWVRAGDRVEFRTYLNLGTLGGVAAAMPDPARPLIPQMRWLVLGGPLASLGLGLAGLALFTLAEGRPAAYALIVAAVSLLVFIVTAVPMRAGGFMSDGLQFLQLSRDPGMVERRTHLIGLFGLSLAGRRPRELDADLLAKAQALAGQETLYDVSVWSISAYHAWDRGDAAAAGEWLDRIASVFDAYPDGFRQSLAVELAHHAAAHRQDLGAALRWKAQAKGGVVDAARRALADAAIARLRGEPSEARRALATAARMLGRGMDPGLSVFSADQVRAAQQALDAELPSARAA